MKKYTNLLVLPAFALGICNLAIADSDDADEFQLLSSAPLSLRDAIARAEADTNALVISAELEEEDEAYIFSMDLVTADGEEMEVHIDAVTGELTTEDEQEGNWFTNLFSD